MGSAYFLFSAVFIGYLSNLMITPLFNNMAGDLGIKIENLGILVTIYGLVAGSVALFAGALSDKYGRKPILVIATLGTALFSVLFALSWSFPSLVIFRVLTAVMAGPLMGCAIAAIPDYIDVSQRGKAVGLMTSAVYMSSIIGVPIGLLIAGGEAHQWRWAFYLVAGLAIVANLMLLLGLKRLAPANPELKLNPLSILKAYLASLADSGRRNICLAYACMFLAHGAYITYYPSYLMVNRSLTIQGMTLLFMLGGLFAFTATFVAGRVSERSRRAKIFGASSTLLCLAMLAIVWSPATASTILLVALPIGLTYMTSDAFRMTSLQLEALEHTDPKTRGAFMGLIAFTSAVCISLGAAFGSAFLAYAKLHWSTHQSPQLEAVSHPNYLQAYDLLTYLAIGLMVLAAFFLIRSRQIAETNALPQET